MTTPLQTGSKALTVGTRTGTDLLQPVDGYPDFPSSLMVLDSTDFISYTQVLEVFTNENKFFALSPAVQITAANQRIVKGKVVGITLPGTMTPDQKFVLSAKVLKAGYVSCDIETGGAGNCAFTLFSITHK